MPCVVYRRSWLVLVVVGCGCAQTQVLVEGERNTSGPNLTPFRTQWLANNVHTLKPDPAATEFVQLRDHSGAHQGPWKNELVIEKIGSDVRIRARWETRYGAWCLNHALAATTYSELWAYMEANHAFHLKDQRSGDSRGTPFYLSIGAQGRRNRARGPAPLSGARAAWNNIVIDIDSLAAKQGAFVRTCAPVQRNGSRVSDTRGEMLSESEVAQREIDKVARRLSRRSPFRAWLHILDLGRFRNALVSEYLVALLGHDDLRFVASACGALARITGEPPTMDPQFWRRWWDNNRASSADWGTNGPRPDLEEQRSKVPRP